MSVEARCRWVRDRLPLLAGGELMGPDRRAVERHLIGCTDCRDRRLSLSGALAVLHRAAALEPGPPDARPLWPDLERQIRESRRPVASGSLLADWWLLIARPAVGLGLAVLLALGWVAAVQYRPERAVVVRESPLPRPALPGPEALTQAAPPAPPEPPAPAARAEIDPILLPGAREAQGAY